MTYSEFLDRKAQLESDGGFDPEWMPGFLYDFQTDLLEWALRKGRSAIFADCGMGKTPMQLVWAENVHRRTESPVLVVAPLAVTFQTSDEAAKFGIEAAVSRNGSAAAPITITNYDQLHHFNSDDYAGVVLDESSAIKAFDGERRQIVTDFIRKTPYRLLCTATAAPNDYVELGTSSEALGYLGYQDMLGRFFTNKESSWVKAFGGGRADWRFKGHAEQPFWRWVASWARALRRPSDLGYADDDFILPELEYRRHMVESVEPREGQLFDLPAFGLKEQNAEMKRTVSERCERAAELLAGKERGIAWCHRTAEGDLLTDLIDGAVQVKGSDSVGKKEERLHAFSNGEIRVLVTKPSIAGWGLNWQHCHRMTYFPSHSYEQFYQAVRRCWRFGQTETVNVEVITTEGGLDILDNLERKAAAADAMFDSLTEHMRDAVSIARTERYDSKVEVPSWL